MCDENERTAGGATGGSVVCQIDEEVCGMVGEPVLRRDRGLHNVGIVSPGEQACTGKFGWQEQGRPWRELL